MVQTNSTVTEMESTVRLNERQGEAYEVVYIFSMLKCCINISINTF